MKKAGSGFRFFHFLYGIQVVLFLFISVDSLQAQSNQNLSQALIQGTPIEQVIAKGEVQSYNIALAAGQFVHVRVTQKGTDVALRLLRPNKEEICSFNLLQGAQRHERMLVIAKETGIHELKIAIPTGSAPPGNYRVEILELKTADENDERRTQAEHLIEEAWESQLIGTGESIKLCHEKANRALALFQAAKDQEGEALALEVQITEVDHTPQIELSKQALAIQRQLGDKPAIGYLLNSVGMAYVVTGDWQNGIEYLQQCLEVVRELDDWQVATNVYGNLAVLYGRTGDAEKSVNFSKQSIAIAEAHQMKNRNIGGYANLGIAYKDLGEYQLSLESYEKSLQLMKELNQMDAAGRVYSNLGNLYRILNNVEKASEYYQLALALSRKKGIELDEALALNNLGLTYYRMGEYQKALEACRQALVIRKKNGDLPGQAAAYEFIGMALNKLGQYENSLENLTSALDLRRKMNERYGIVFNLQHLTELEMDRGNYQQGLPYIEEAINLTEANRSTINAPDLRLSYGSKIQEEYSVYVDLLLRLHQQEPTAGYDQKALQMSEKARARSMLESLIEGRLDLRSGVKPELLEREKVIQKKINDSSSQLARQISGKPDEAKIKKTQNELDTLTKEYKDILTQIRLESPRYASLTQPQPLSAKEIQSEIMDDQTVLLEYALGDQQSWLFAATKNGVQTFKLHGEQEINNAARKFYEALTARESATDLKGIDDKINSTGAALSQLILSPVAKQLNNEWKGKRLAIVASGALEYVPFSALPEMVGSDRGAVVGNVANNRSPTTAPRPLITDHEIVNLPSASVLGVIRQEISARKSAPKQVAVFADPVFEKNDPRFAQAKNQTPSETPKAEVASNTNTVFSRAMRDFDSKRDQLGRLTFSKQEAEAIASMTSKEQSLQRVSFAANRANAMSEELSQYRIIHFATHGMLNSEHPELSGLVFSLVDEKGKPQDGFLRLHDIYNLKLPADLVVLSACQTALGKEVKGEGLIGLTRGFMYAGAPRVVASLWRVNDYATAELMKRFYAGMLKENLAPAAALRAAQLGMLKQKRFGNPYYWAAFTLQGEWK